jgi:hypothetical protein
LHSFHFSSLQGTRSLWRLLQSASVRAEASSTHSTATTMRAISAREP